MKFMILIFVLLFSACASLTGLPEVNYNDGTWSNCLFQKDEIKVDIPMQNVPPVGTNIPGQGVLVKCESIPKA